MHRSRRSSTSSDSDYGAPIRITKTQVLPVSRSHTGRHRHHSPDTVVVNANNYLQLPGQRARASSTSGQPVPVINNYYTDDRKRSHSHHRGRRDSSGSSHHRSRSQRRYYDDLPPDLLVDLALNDRETEQRKRDKAIKDALREAKYKEEEEKEERQRIILEAKLKEEADKKKAEEKEKEIVAAWKQKEREEKEKKEAEKKEFDEKYESRVRMDFLAAGYSESTIDSIIKKKKDKEAQNRLAIEKARPTFIRVHTRYLDTRTLVHYDLPWEYDRVSCPTSAD